MHTGRADKANEGKLLTWRMRVADLRGRGLYAGYPDRYRCIFVHVPKTAGSSVALALFGEGSRHVPCFEYRRANPRKFRTYFKFAFVRNPWDRLVSAYFFLKGGGKSEMDRAWAAEHLPRHSTFGEFVRSWLREENIGSSPHFQLQSHFVADAQGQVIVDFLGRYEGLASDFAEVAGRLGRNCTLPLYNSSRHAHFATYYDAETRDIVGRVYRRDIDLFGYEFDG